MSVNYEFEIENSPRYKIPNEENYESQGGPSAVKKHKIVAKKRVSAEKRRAEESLESQAAEQVKSSVLTCDVCGRKSDTFSW